jgi:Phospholipase_D-nuclease N-terminal
VRFFLLLDIATLALLVYCLIDCIQTESVLVRNLPKPFWLVLIVLLPLVGGIAWLVAGRPENAATAATGRGPWPPSRARGASGYQPPRPLGPDDDEEFLRQMRAIDAEHQRTLDQWERDLRERERKLREGGEPPAEGTPPADGPAPSGGPR